MSTRDISSQAIYTNIERERLDNGSIIYIIIIRERRSIRDVLYYNIDFLCDRDRKLSQFYIILDN